MNVWDKLGDSRVIEGLKHQMAGDEIAHAWLLLGPAGSGKKAAAKAMAASLNCTVQPGVGCGTCSICARIMRRRFPDVHHISPEGSIIAVDVIRENIIPEASRSPFEGRRKVFIIEEADLMNDSAQNAILKTLEEPQPDTIFILISSNEEEVLETIFSRCRVIRLDPVPESRIVELLEDDGASPETALLAARLSSGDFDRACQLAEDEETMARRKVWISIASRLHNPVDAMDASSEILEQSRSAVKAREKYQKKEVEELADAMGETRGTAAARNSLAKRHKRELRRLEQEVFGEALDSLASFYRDVLAARRGSTESVANLDLLGELEVWAGSPISDAALLRASELCVQTRGTFQHNANPPLQLESLLVQLAVLAPPPAPAWS